jgi:Raf kinase inhibitor-like YbhB/YbcL family protein
MKRIAVHTALVLALAASAGWAYAQTETAAQSGPPVLAKEVLPAPTGVRLLVTSDAFNSGAPLDDKYTQNGDNMSPPLAWSKGPAGTQSYAVFAEDAGVNRHDPITHWVVYDIPSTTTKLRENMPAEAKLDSGIMQGLNVRKAAGFVGPKPPAGQTHPYHFQVFALNRRVTLDPAKADRDAVLAAMKGHVLAVGDIVVNYTGK